jgi:DNA-binding transcriptional ArsR family regulator
MENQMASATRGKWRGVSDAALGAIVAHPVRCRLIAIFAVRVASPNEIAQELGMPVGDVSYHVRTLKDAGIIELVEERPVRGSTEHFYRTVINNIVLTDEEYQGLSIDQRVALARQTFQLATAEASVSLETRKFGERHNHHIARVPFSVDEQAWNELSELHREMLDRMIEICSESNVRAVGSEEPRIPGIAFAALFEMPYPTRAAGSV